MVVAAVAVDLVCSVFQLTLGLCLQPRARRPREGARTRTTSVVC